MNTCRDQFTLLLALAIALTLLGACSDESGGSQRSTDDVALDTAPTEDVRDEDTSPAPDDVSADTDSLEPEPDVAPIPDTEDAAEDTDEVTEEVDVTPDPEPLATACADDDACAEDERCLGGYCRLLAGPGGWVSTDFTLNEPSQVTHVFDAVKGLSNRIAFVGLLFQQEEEVLDAQGIPVRTGRFPVEYGSVDIIEGTQRAPRVTQWQFPRPFWMPDGEYPEGRGLVAFSAEPLTSAFEVPHVWISDPFRYNLVARVRLGQDEFTISLTAEEARFRVELDAGNPQRGLGVVLGVLTRDEAERALLNRHEEIVPLRRLLCRADPEYDPRALEPSRDIWTLADLLDCNDTPMDVDSSEDGENDAYFVRMTAPVVRAVINP